MRRLPSLRSFEAFAAAARHQHFTQAAEELCVTPGAISRAVRQLEDELQVILFERQGSRLKLSRAGLVLSQHLEQLLAQLAQTMDQLKSHPAEVRLTLLPSLAACWLAPQLHAFIAQHPDISLSIHASQQSENLARKGLDLALRFGPGEWPGLQAVELGEDWLIPVCTTRILQEACPAPALLQQQLLHPQSLETWTHWFQACGMDIGTLSGPRFNDASSLLQAAQDGAGIALVRAVLALRPLQTGQLIIASPHALRCQYRYWLVRPEGASPDPAVTRVEQWLKHALAKTYQDLVPLLRETQIHTGKGHALA